ncbi:MAG: ATP-grasp domain-containing protein [Spirochaetes bacterium]|nr:ATP-grasp domain-containing protein [Spirochaetota bacterium]
MPQLWKKNKSALPKFLVSIGAGINQIPLIQEAKRLGFRTIGVDQNHTAPGFLSCDIRIIESIENYNEIYVKLKEFALIGDICGILSKSYGSAIKSAAFLADQFNCPLLPFRRVDDFLYKDRMKNIFRKNKIPSPRFFIIPERKKFRFPSTLRFPVVIKPTEGHAKKGVQLVADLKELDTLLATKKNVPLMVEEFIEGDEIIVSGLIHNGKFHLVEITDKAISPPPYFVDIMHISPSQYFSLSKEISAIGQEIATAFEIATSPLIMEIKIHPTKGIFLIEAVPEFGGEFIPEFIVPHRTGYNLIAETIKAITGQEFKIPQPHFGNKSVVVKYITGNSGQLFAFTPITCEEIPGLLFYRIFKDIGSSITPPSTNHDRIGVVIAEGKTTKEAIAACDAAIEKIAIDIR